MRVTVSRSRTGLPTLAERGGGMTTTGDAVIVAGPVGAPVAPLIVPRRGRFGGDHALFVARPGMHIVHVWRDRAGARGSIRQIIRIGTAEHADDLETTVVGEWEQGDGNVPEFLMGAAEAAVAKTHCWHCRDPHWAAVERERLCCGPRDGEYSGWP